MRRNISGCFGNRKKDYVWESITPIIAKEMLWGQLFYCHQMKKKFTKLEQSWGHVRQDFLESKWSDKIAEAVIFAGSGSYLVVDKEEEMENMQKNIKGHMVGSSHFWLLILSPVYHFWF